MQYKSKIYQLNSLRLGLVHEDNLYGKPSIFVAMASQDNDVSFKIKKYLELEKQKTHNVICMPFNFHGYESGDNYEIYTYYENILGVYFYVVEKMKENHNFFQDFGIPKINFTEYHFNEKNKFVGMKTYE